jgi:hypothetical protein
MKKKFLIIGSLAFFHFLARAQPAKDSAQEKISKTEIELVYNHYIQDGNNSAVTGGIGTEKLTVYGPAINIKNTSGKHSLAFDLGTDIISSASTDKIDFVTSSASKRDARYHLNTTYERALLKHNISVFGGLGFSIESDYFSIASKLGLSKEDKKHLRSFSAQFQIFNDDLRWGRINIEYFRPVTLIYPSELRYKEWYNTYKRNSYNFKLGFTQAINKKNVLGLFPEMAYQQGLLATPFHRIYFTDSTESVEQLPGKRFKAALAFRLNSFAGGNIIFKNTINGYADNFGILAFSIENETALKLKPELTLLPNARFYMQKGSPYFAEYREHKSDEEFYTSDFDLSAFQTYNIGIGLKYSPFKYLGKRLAFNTSLFRYNYMYRSNNLSAHIFSLVLQTEYDKKKNAPRKDVKDIYKQLKY